jgi:hypothetical protein
MIPTNFPQANSKLDAPEDEAENHYPTAPAYVGAVKGGPLDGADLVIVAWQPSDEEREKIASGSPVFYVGIGGSFPHYLATEFPE